MGLEFLARVRSSSLWVATVAALVMATYAAPLAGLALAAGAAWSLINLALLQGLIVALTGADRRTMPATWRAIAAIGGLLALFAAGWLMLTRLSPALLAIGFGIPFVVMVLKATALLLLPSAAWRRLTKSPWIAAAAVVVLIAGLWVVAGRAAGERHGAAHTESLAGAVRGGAGAHEAARSGEAEESGPQKFPNVITVLHRLAPHAPLVGFLHHYEVLVFSLGIALLLCLVAWFASRNPQMIPGPLQNGAEMAVEALSDFFTGILGPRHGPRFVPFLGTLFIYILAMNLFGLIPLMDSPTSSLNVTVALALIVFVYAQYVGFRELGLLGWLDHMAGSPRTAIGWFLVPLMLPIHIMGELAKPISLSCRLFGNVFGEDMLLVAFASMVVVGVPFTRFSIGIPLHFPFFALALLSSVLQAGVFSILTSIYLLLMLPHDDHGHEGEAHAQHAH
ncbi:MAG: F0F1 ATP synthase subunit A [Candidatus Eisenbacteria bacterium]|nr:F0F1 ATP synthase subunit A [Candidatus Eisenbacteria bacterium]